MMAADPQTPSAAIFDDSPPSSTPAFLAPVVTTYNRFTRQYQQLLDRSAPHTLHRWLGTAGVLAVFFLRIVLAQGWYIVCYAHAIYLLNLLLSFLQPRFDPSLESDLVADEIEEGGPDEYTLPSQQQKDDEFRPFIRRLPEWNFWLSTTRATLIALFCTMFEMFDIPVYWPILVGYFIALFAMTMRRQIQHMVKYKYIPFDFGRKTRYGNSPR